MFLFTVVAVNFGATHLSEFLTELTNLALLSNVRDELSDVAQFQNGLLVHRLCLNTDCIGYGKEFA